MSNAAGTVAKDWKRFANDSQAAIDTLANSWDRLAASTGKAIVVAGGANLMDWASQKLDKNTAISAHLQDQGLSLFERGQWFSRYQKSSEKERAGMEWRAGYVSDEQRKTIDAYQAYGNSRQSAVDAANLTPSVKRDRTGMPVVGPIPTARPDPSSVKSEIVPVVSPAVAAAPRDTRRVGVPLMSTWDRPFEPGKSPRDAERESMHALRSDPNGIADAIDEALASGGDRARQAIEDAARKVNEAGGAAGSAFTGMLQGAAELFGQAAARSFNANIRPVMAGSGGGTVSVNPGVAPVVVP